MSALEISEAASTREPDPADRMHWLAHCEGYRVDSPGGRVGLVEEVRRARHSGHAESLAVLAGRIGLRRLIIPVEEVEAVVPHAERILLRHGATLTGCEPVFDGRGRR